MIWNKNCINWNLGPTNVGPRWHVIPFLNTQLFRFFQNSSRPLTTEHLHLFSEYYVDFLEYHSFNASRLKMNLSSQLILFRCCEGSPRNAAGMFRAAWTIKYTMLVTEGVLYGRHLRVVPLGLLRAVAGNKSCTFEQFNEFNQYNFSYNKVIDRYFRLFHIEGVHSI